MMVWLQFAFCTAVIMYAGSRLSKYGDIISEKTGMSGSWIGVILMASVTSLPELITGVSSVAMFDLPEIAIGDVLGSCMFNILLIAVLDFIGGDKPILSQGGDEQMHTALFSVFMIGLAALAIAGSEQVPTVGWIGISSIFILVVYFASMRFIFAIEKQKEKDEKEEEFADTSRKRAFTIYGVNAVVVIAAATWLPKLGEKIARMTGLGESFVGTLFVALATSLPELVITYTALRRGAVDMALGNLFGSNLFNIAIFAVDDIAYRKGPILAEVGSDHAVTAAGAILLSLVALIGIVTHSPNKKMGFGWASVAIIVLFCAVSALSYAVGKAEGG